MERFFKNIVLKPDEFKLPVQMEDFSSFLISFFSFHCETNEVYFLIDFGQLRNVGETEFEELVILSKMKASKLCTVIALSSGEGHDLPDPKACVSLLQKQKQRQLLL